MVTRRPAVSCQNVRTAIHFIWKSEHWKSFAPQTRVMSDSQHAVSEIIMDILDKSYTQSIGSGMVIGDAEKLLKF